MATQIIANHVLAMKFAGKLFRADNFKQQEAIEKVYAKLARTMRAQIEALQRQYLLVGRPDKISQLRLQLINVDDERRFDRGTKVLG